MLMRLRLLPIAMIAITTASGCSMFGGPEQAALHKSPNFQSGYEDGCASANQQGSDLRDRLVQDKGLYQTDEAYRTGWSNGFSACRTTNTPPGTEPGGNPLGGPPMGAH
jgi:hypothetical protein